LKLTVYVINALLKKKNKNKNGLSTLGQAKLFENLVELVEIKDELIGLLCELSAPVSMLGTLGHCGRSIQLKPVTKLDV